MRVPQGVTPFIRPLGDAEIGRLQAVYREAFGESWPLAECAKTLSIPGTLTLLLWLEESCAGFIVLRALGEEGEIITIGVLPEYRQRGFGALLLAEAMRRGREVGIRRMLLEVAVDNRAALALYTRHGFQEAGRRPAYYRRENGTFADALLLQCECVETA